MRRDVTFAFKDSIKYDTTSHRIYTLIQNKIVHSIVVLRSSSYEGPSQMQITSLDTTIVCTFEVLRGVICICDIVSQFHALQTTKGRHRCKSHLLILRRYVLLKFYAL